ncbi:hypothetical protein [Ferrimonas senticii]|uniref:hypothetical protein n=1 Tax=Ferrimonas senticii TaxID=394566 RepID=UPI0004244370|nr:hypothetical protein [Ferrimonas senticii]
MSRNAQQGAALLLAVFVISVMALLALVLAESLQLEDNNQTLDILGSRSLAAANSGVDWGLAEVLNRGANSAVESCRGANRTLAVGQGLADVIGFNNCNVTVSCRHQSVTETPIQQRFVIMAKATCGPDNLAVSRTIEALAYD